MMRGYSSEERRVLTISGKLALVLMLFGVGVMPMSAQQRPGTPAGLVVFDNVGGNPVADGELFLAVGPNNVTEANIAYRLFYALSADEPSRLDVISEYEFGSTPGDGGGENAFGFVLGGSNLDVPTRSGCTSETRRRIFIPTPRSSGLYRLVRASSRLVRRSLPA
jgi:hypothetical protein